MSRPHPSAAAHDEHSNTAISKSETAIHGQNRRCATPTDANTALKHLFLGGSHRPLGVPRASHHQTAATSSSKSHPSQAIHPIVARRPNTIIASGQMPISAVLIFANRAVIAENGTVPSTGVSLAVVSSAAISSIARTIVSCSYRFALSPRIFARLLRSCRLVLPFLKVLPVWAIGELVAL